MAMVIGPAMNIDKQDILTFLATALKKIELKSFVFNVRIRNIKNSVWTSIEYDVLKGSLFSAAHAPSDKFEGELTNLHMSKWAKALAIPSSLICSAT